MPDRRAAADATAADAAREPWPRWVWPLLAASVAAGVVARFVTTSPLWLDEALSVNIAGLPLGEIHDALARDGHPPLYYWLLHGWIELFGDGDVAVRSLSGVCSVATLPLAWLAGVRVAGRTGGVWAVVVLAVSPYAVRYATEARMYSLVMLLVLAGYLLLRRILAGGGALDVAGLVLVTGALLWTHYWALYLLTATGAVLLWRWWDAADRRPVTGRALAGLAGGGVLFLPWLPTLLDQADSTGTPWAVPSRPTQILSVTLDDLGGGGFAEAQLYGLVLVLLVGLAAFGRVADQGRVELVPRLSPALHDELIVVGATFLLGGVAAYATQGAYASRYAAVVAPLVLLAAGAGLTRLRWGWFLWGLGGAVLGLGAVGVAHNAVTARTQVGDLAEVIRAEATDGDVVVACPDQLGPSVERALRGGRPVPVVPYPLAGDPRFVDWRDYEERNAAADPAAFGDAVLDRAGGGTIWVVWNGTYRTLTGQCENLIDHLSTRRAGTVVAITGEQFEPANLYRFE